ncbi:hypothetical protein ACRRTK_023737 [Alexandromys fortis]
MGAAAVRWHLCVLLALGARGRLVGGSGLPGKREDQGDCGARGPKGRHPAPSEAAPHPVLPPCKVTSGSARGPRGRGGLGPREGKREAGERKEERRPPAGPGMRTKTGGDPLSREWCSPRAEDLAAVA